MQAKINALPQNCIRLACKQVDRVEFADRDRTGTSEELITLSYHKAGKLGIPMDRPEWRVVRDDLHVEIEKAKTRAVGTASIPSDSSKKKDRQLTVNQRMQMELMRHVRRTAGVDCSTMGCASKVRKNHGYRKRNLETINGVSRRAESE